MEKIKVVMVDDNENLIEMVEEYFCDNKNIEIYKKAFDGVSGIDLIEKEKGKYDVIILDLVMPKKDGLFVLQEMQKRGINEKVIVLTSYNGSHAIKEAANLGVSYFMLKPFDNFELEKRILELCRLEDEIQLVDFYHNNIQVTITRMLHELGIPSHIKGYQYLREAIGIIFDRPETIGGITKELYPELAGKFDTTVSRVERAIRHAIEVSWNRGNLDLMEEIFGHSVDIDKAKPTNSEFVVTIADKLRLDFNRVGC